MRKNFDIIHGNPRQCLFAMVLPMMAAMFLNMAYNLVDSLWIGNLLGESAYAALTAATPILFAAQFHRNGGDQRGCYFALSGHWGGRDTTNPNHPVYFIYFKYCVFSWDDRIIGGNGIPFASVSSSSIGAV